MTARLNGQELPEGWVWVNFGKVFDIQGGSQPSKDSFVYEPQEGYVRLLQIRDYGDKPVPTFVPVESVTKFCEQNDVMIARYGASLGRVLTGMQGAYNVALVKVIFDHNDISNRYVFYFLQTQLFQIPIHMISRSAQNGFNKSDIYPINVPLAPLNEQHRIVDAIETQFTRLDAAVTALKRSQANLKRYRASVLKAACEGRLVPTEAELAQTEGRSYEPATVLLDRILTERRQQWMAENPKKRYKEPVAPDTSDLLELPEGWVWATVEQLADHEQNSITDGPFGSKLKTSHYTDEGPRVIRLQNIGDGVFYDEYAHISEEHFNSLTKHQVFTGDIVIAALGTELPRACIMPSHVGLAIVKADCMRFKPHPKLISAAYAKAALNSKTVRQIASQTVHGIGRPRLNQQEVKEIVVPLPPLAEQQRIVAEVERRLSLIDQLEKTVGADLARANRLRQSILKRAFAGKLVPQDPNDEPASVLLERIQAAKHGEPVQPPLIAVAE